MSACSRDLETAELIPIEKNVGQVVFQNHFQKLVAGFGDCPAVLLVMVNNQTMGFRCRLELAVVIGVASAAILNPVNVVPVVNHLMQKGGGNLFNGSGQRSGTDVDFMGAAQRGNPGVLPQREMTVGFWRGLDGDGGSRKFTFKELCVQKVENLVEIPGDTIVTGELLHGVFLLDFGGAEAYNKHTPE